MTRFATWWGQAFAEALTVAAPVPVARGKAKTRAAKIRGLDPKTGEASIEVSASSVLPYEVRIAIQPIPDEVWAKADDQSRREGVLRGEAARVRAAERSGRRVSRSRWLPLPRRRPGADPLQLSRGPGGCRHGATAQRALSEAVDRDPFLLFDLRGRPRAQVLEALGLTARDQEAAGSRLDSRPARCGSAERSRHVSPPARRPCGGEIPRGRAGECVAAADASRRSSGMEGHAAHRGAGAVRRAGGNEGARDCARGRRRSRHGDRQREQQQQQR